MSRYRDGVRSTRALSALALVAAWTIGLGRPAHAGPLNGVLAPRVVEVLRQTTAVGVHVVDLATGQTVYGFEADRLRVIASNTKLLTTAAALDGLGPGYLFETEVLVRGGRRGAALLGDLAVVGGGDPNISGRHHEGDSLAVFRDWASRLRREGIRRIDGDLLLVDGLFEPPLVHPDWPREQLSRWYQAPVAALSFNDNCVLVRVSAGSENGGPGRVELIPELSLFEVRNEVVTVDSVRRHRVVIERAEGAPVLSISGGVYRWAAPFESWVTVPDPVIYFGAALRKALTEEGVTVTGELRPTRELPDGDWRRLVIQRSDLLTALEVTNKRSQNFFAESLLKLLGAELCARGSWDAGRQAVVELLERIGIRPGSYELADGSGLSRSNRFTPRQLTTVLRYMFFHRRGPEFVRSLPFSGEADLRWEERLADQPYRGNVLAKTGSLRGVSTLSGYAKAQSGRVYAFSILLNHTRGGRSATRAQDQILRALMDRG